MMKTNFPTLGTDCIGIVVCFFCHDGNGRFVMDKRSTNARDEQGTWEIGGGAVELHDGVEGTLKREVKEEYGADIHSFEFLGFRDVHRLTNGKKSHWITLDFKVLVDPIQVKNGEPKKFDAVEWFTPGTLPNPTHSQFKTFMKKYQKKL